MADGRHLGEIKKSPYLRKGLTNHHEIWRGDASSILLMRGTEILKIQDGGGRHIEKLKNCHISATVPWIATKFGTGTHTHMTPLNVLTIKILKI